MDKCPSCGFVATETTPRKSILRELQEVRERAVNLMSDDRAALDRAIGGLEALAVDVDNQAKHPGEAIIQPRDVRVRLAGTAPLPLQIRQRAIDRGFAPEPRKPLMIDTAR